MREDCEVDLEKGRLDECEEETTNSPEKRAISLLDRFDGDKTVNNGEKRVVITVKASSPARETGKTGCGRSGRKEKRKKTSASKPPRPPRGPSLDAADHKLMKEIVEIAMLKRAKIQRMRALKKTKAAKAASAASSVGNVLATVFTLILCFVIVFQGMSPRAASKSLGNSLLEGNPSAIEPNGAYTRPVIEHTGLPKDTVSLLRSNRKISLGFSPK